MLSTLSLFLFVLLHPFDAWHPLCNMLLNKCIVRRIFFLLSIHYWFFKYNKPFKPWSCKAITHVRVYSVSTETRWGKRYSKRILINLLNYVIRFRSIWVRQWQKKKAVLVYVCVDANFKTASWSALTNYWPVFKNCWPH